MTIPETNTTNVLSNNLRALNDDNWNAQGLKSDTLPTTPIFNYQQSLAEKNNQLSQQPASSSNLLLIFGFFVGGVLALKFLFD